MATYRYNYPWSGRVGGYSCCIYCGETGMSFTLASGDRCLKSECRERKEPDPELLARNKADFARRANAWCEARGIDYNATVENFEKMYGPQFQERETPIPLPPNYIRLATIFKDKSNGSKQGSPRLADLPIQEESNQSEKEEA